MGITMNHGISVSIKILKNKQLMASASSQRCGIGSILVLKSNAAITTIKNVTIEQDIC